MVQFFFFIMVTIKNIIFKNIINILYCNNILILLPIFNKEKTLVNNNYAVQSKYSVAYLLFIDFL